MHIQNHNLQLGSERSYNRSESEQESLRVGRVSTDAVTGNRRVDVVFEAAAVSERELSLYSAQALRAQSANTLPPAANASVDTGFETASSTEASESPLEQLPAEDRLKLDLIARLHKAITGKEIRMTLMDPGVLEAHANIDAPKPPASAAPPAAPAQPAIGLEYQRSLRIDESEQTRFTASGRVTTADGQQINIELELQMARSITVEQHQSLRLGARLSDPLVLNFDGIAAELSSTRFQFDLDLDGTEDSVPTLAGNSAFLVLDKNVDGKINDGSEMFGARSGNGFAELAQYDDDGNGFIDEGDDIFSRLRLWSPTADGQGDMLSLTSQNVGAIYLGSADTEFSLTPNLQENRLGVIRSSGIYLSEEGRVGSVQQLDLSI
ncbi:hypothetical protein GCM10009104_01830 [Marinobacterium maritimum]|uniref:VCBS repeat-containing protein n=1 Tax=Marinobacterium maritimum TaxID=500162 RepID=A0ABN1I1M4_9GAMM